MTKIRTTLTIDEEVWKAVRVRAARTGQRDSDVIEAALRRDLGFDLLERLWERSDMTDDEATRAALREELTELFAAKTRDEWAETFADSDATVEPGRTLPEALDHPQTDSRGIVERTQWPQRIGFPARSSDHADPATGVPGHGAQTEAVLREAGYTDRDIAELRESGAAVFGE